MRPQVGTAGAAVSVPRWGREAPGGAGLSQREAPGRPQGGGPWGYCATHMRRSIGTERRLADSHSTVAPVELRSVNSIFANGALALLQ